MLVNYTKSGFTIILSLLLLMCGYSKAKGPVFTVKPDRQSLDTLSDMNNNYMIIITVVLVLFVVVLVSVILLRLKLKKEKKLKKVQKITGLYCFQTGNLKRYKLELGIGQQAELLPYNNNYEFPRNKLELGKLLGSGAFGNVFKADAFGITPKKEKTTVAVKTVKDTADNIQIIALISELKILIHLGQHINLVNLLGACTENIIKRELLVIVEYCQFGNVHNYLLQNRQNYIDQIDSVTGNIDYSLGSEDLESVSADFNNAIIPSESHSKHFLSLDSTRTYESNTCNNNIQLEWRLTNCAGSKENSKPIFTKDLISWSFQLARGMEYLASQKIIHGDLAARNILLSENNIVKICNFGLQKRLHRTVDYKLNTDGRLSMKWMAIESIQDQVFSTESDVWSYGIVLWELFSLGQTPYPGIEANKSLYHKLLDGCKLESPPYAPKEMYNIMWDCWNNDPVARPSFNKLGGTVGLMLEENIRQHYIALNDPYFVMNTQRLKERQKDYLAMISHPDPMRTPAYLGMEPAYLTVLDEAEKNNYNNYYNIE